MLQQTTVKMVVPFFERWMRQIPDFEALARATEEDVVLLWSGLGYYSRARRLRELAPHVLHTSPKKYEEWLQLPGIGPYTAAAIASIAWDDPVAVVDGNVVRVWSRLTNEVRVFKSQHAARQHFSSIAQEHIFVDAPGDYNQAMMDLGATICTPRDPQCTQCPLSRECMALRCKNIHTCPHFESRPRRRQRKVRLWIQRGQQLLVRRISDSSATSLNGLYELPEWSEETRAFTEIEEFFFSHKRSIGQCTFTEDIYRASIRALPDNPDFTWICNVDTVALSGPHRRWIVRYLLTPGS
jgi:A/G-specific adenine glycosylase